MDKLIGIGIGLLMSLTAAACADTSDKAAAPAMSAAEETGYKTDEKTEENIMYIKAGDSVLTAELSDNSSAQAFKELLSKGDLTVEMSDYGNFEKVGSLGVSLPRNDEQINTQAGDIILYQGDKITIYYDTNSWSFTRLGKVTGATAEELKSILGEGDITVTFSLEK